MTFWGQVTFLFPSNPAQRLAHSHGLVLSLKSRIQIPLPPLPNHQLKLTQTRVPRTTANLMGYRLFSCTLCRFGPWIATRPYEPTSAFASKQWAISMLQANHCKTNRGSADKSGTFHKPTNTNTHHQTHARTHTPVSFELWPWRKHEIWAAKCCSTSLIVLIWIHLPDPVLSLWLTSWQPKNQLSA